MWALFGRKSKIKPVRDGRRERRTCPLCGEDTTFVEVKVEKTYTAYVVVNLYESESVAFQCGACHEVMDIESTGEPQLTKREQAKLAKANAKAEAKRKKELEAAAKKAREKEQAKEAALDDELAAMKSRLGID